MGVAAQAVIKVNKGPIADFYIGLLNRQSLKLLQRSKPALEVISFTSYTLHFHEVILFSGPNFVKLLGL